MVWRFFLDGNQVEEPIGWESVQVKLVRDSEWHGVFSQYSIQMLGFSCNGANYIAKRYETNGVDARIDFVVEYSCNGSPFLPFFAGTLVVSTMEMREGTLYVFCNVEAADTTMTLRNRYETAVDILSGASLSGAPLPPPNPGFYPVKVQSDDASQTLRKVYRASLKAGPIIDVIGKNSELCTQVFTDYNEKIRYGWGAVPSSTCNAEQWLATASYDYGDVVSYMGNFYRRITAPPPFLTGAPNIDTVNWQQLTKSDAMLQAENLVFDFLDSGRPQCGPFDLDYVMNNDFLALDPGKPIGAGTDDAKRGSNASASFTAQSFFNELGPQPQGNGLIGNYNFDETELWAYNDNDGGTQSKSPRPALFVAPEPGDYNVRIKCGVDFFGILGAVTDRQLRTTGSDNCTTVPGNWAQNRRNNFHYVRLTLVYKRGGLQTTLYDSGPLIPNDGGNRFGQNAVCVTGSVPINFNEVVPMNSGDTVELFFFFEWCGKYNRRTGRKTSVFGVAIIHADVSNDCCFEVVLDQKFQSLPNQDIVLFPPYEVFDRVCKILAGPSVKVNSSLLGRPDSAPVSKPVYGCASLTCLTNGFFIRGFPYLGSTNPVPVNCDGSQDPYSDVVFRKLQVSLKELFMAFDAIYCIGLGYDYSTNEVIVESRDFFYQPAVSLTLSLNDIVAAGLVRRVDGERIWNTFLTGYAEWETENTNGLNEFNSSRTWILPVDSYKNVYEKVCPFIAGGYTVELVRRESIVLTGLNDNKYDEKVFLIQLGEMYQQPSYSLTEKGVGPPFSGLINPTSLLNWRLRPAVMARRHLFWLASSVFHAPFSSGWLKLTAAQGNFFASGADLGSLQLPATCNYGVTTENAPLDCSVTGVPPLARPEIYFLSGFPMSVADFDTLRTFPYRKIALNLPWGTVFGWIKTATYKPSLQEVDLEIIAAY